MTAPRAPRIRRISSPLPPRRAHDLRAEVDGGRAHEGQVTRRVARAVRLGLALWALRPLGFDRVAEALFGVGAEAVDRGGHRGVSNRSTQVLSVSSASRML